MTMIARARGMVALVSQTLSEWIVLSSSSSAFYHPRIHLAPSILDYLEDREKSEEVVIRIVAQS